MKTTRKIVYLGLATVVLACFALSPAARAVCQQGCDLGNGNTFLGDGVLSSNTTGSSNAGTGDRALFSNTTGDYNTATGAAALYSNTAGSNNSANGVDALANNTTGSHNVANGASALVDNTTGNYNTANGAVALAFNTTGFNNTADGFQALYRNTTGSGNMANGLNALYDNTTGNYNTANGVEALFSNTTGFQNTANGVNALRHNISGSLNVATGVNAGRDLTTGSGNVCIGVNVYGVAGESNTTRIRNVYSSIVSGRAVYVNSNNKIGTIASSRRFKEEIKPMEKASESILALKPVTFRYKKEIDASGTKQFGLIAEEVEKVNPKLVTCDEEGKPQSVRYEAINAMLLNEFLKEHRKMEEQEATIIQLKATVAQQQKDFQAAIARQQKAMEVVVAHLKEQDSKIQKVSDQLELSKAAPRTVAENR